MKNIIVNLGGGYSSIHRKGASVRELLVLGNDLERGSEVRLIGGDSYGC